MNLSELHPDELLWREACGTLSPNERADLTAHLQRCPACALERVVRMEAARVRVPSEADHALAARLVDRVLAASERRPVTAIRSGWRRPLAVAAMLLLFVAGSAVAATALVVRVREQRASRVIKAAPRATSTHPVRNCPTSLMRLSQRGGTFRPPRLPRPITAPSSAPTPGLCNRVRWRSRRPRIGPGTDIGGADRGGTAAVTRSDAGAGGYAAACRWRGAGGRQCASRGRLRQPTPRGIYLRGRSTRLRSRRAALLRRAEQARTAKRWAEASRASWSSARRYSGTREEIVGRALYGQLLLDQLDEPGRALTMFERYLAADPSGALAEEARLGRAQALRRLGRARDERAAWLELLREHPGSVHAAAAQTRLATLDSP